MRERAGLGLMAVTILVERGDARSIRLHAQALVVRAENFCIPEPLQQSPEFTGALGEAIIDVSNGPGTGPAQAVASDLQMDWDLACSSAGFRKWLRQAAAPR